MQTVVKKGATNIKFNVASKLCKTEKTVQKNCHKYQVQCDKQTVQN